MGIINPIYLGLCSINHHRIFGKARCLIRTLVQGKELQLWRILFFTLDIIKKIMITFNSFKNIVLIILLHKAPKIGRKNVLPCSMLEKYLSSNLMMLVFILWFLKIKRLAAAINDIRKWLPHHCTNAGFHLNCIHSRATKTSKISMEV